MIYEITKKHIRIKFNGDDRITAILKKSFRNASYNYINDYWVAPNDDFNLLRLQTLIDNFGFIEGSTDVSIYFDPSTTLPTKSEVEYITKLIDTELDLILTPKPYQYTGVTYMLKHKSCINGDDMGLGKTGQSIIAAEIGELFPCLVITLSCVKFNWGKEWGKWVSGRDVSIIDGNNCDFNKDAVVINYDLLSKHQAKLAKVKWQAMIVDESHSVKNNKAIRSKVVRKLSKKIEYKFLLSGTAMRSRPSELIHQLQILGKFESIFGSFKKFIFRFCDATTTRFGLDYSGSSNMLLLNKKLRENCYIRREWSEVDDDIPDISHIDIDINTSNRKDFEHACSDLFGYLNDRTNGDFDFDLNAETLVLLSNLERISIDGKIKGLIEWINNFLETTDEKLVVFGINTSQLELLSNTFGGKLIYGKTPSANKLAIVEEFKDSSNRLLFGNIQSMGTGTDGLQYAASNVLFTQYPDTPGEFDQAITRIFRQGQKKPVFVYRTFATHGIDYMQMEALKEKYDVTNAGNKGIMTKKNQNSNIKFELIKKLMTCT